MKLLITSDKRDRARDHVIGVSDWGAGVGWLD